MGWFDKVKGTQEEPQLGDLVKDRITGLTGVVECVSEWLNACKRMTIQPIELSEAGMPKERHTFDSPQLIVVTKGYYKLPTFTKEEKTGGPSIAPVGRKEQF